MRAALLALTLTLAASPAFAFCPIVPDDTGTIAAKEAQMLCEQQELAAATAARQAELQRQSDLLQQKLDLDFQQRMQQTLAASQSIAQPLVY